MPRALLLAMSGVRVVDDRLRNLGLTLPGFIERGKVIASMPSLGLLTVAAHTPEGWSVEYREHDEGQLPESDHDLIAISSLPARIDDAYAAADRFRALGKKVVIGGLHASARPEEASRHCDAVIVGEGEGSWKEALGDWPNLKPIYRASRSHEFDWKLPRFDLLDISLYNRIPIQTTRGCPLDCAFCGASRLISPYKRKRIEWIQAELEAVLARWPRPFIELADDNSFVNKNWAKSLARLFAKYPLRWFTETDASVGDDPELLELLAESGCAQLLIGFESAQSDALSETDSKDWKKRRFEGYFKTIQTVQSHGISVNACFIHGFDHQDAGCFEATKAFIRDSGVSEAQVTILTPFPGTALYDRLERENRLLEPGAWSRCTLFDVTFTPSKMSVAELESGFRQLVADVYSVEETRRRQRIMRSDYRRKRRHGQSIQAPVQSAHLSGNR